MNANLTADIETEHGVDELRSETCLLGLLRISGA
jgi:hypothetical protein